MNLFKTLFFLQSAPTDTQAAGRFSHGYGNAVASEQAFGPLGQRPERQAGASDTDVPGVETEEPGRSPRGWGVLDTLLLLGGRPMCAGHHFDVDDPFGCR